MTTKEVNVREILGGLVREDGLMMTQPRKAWYIVGYTADADVWCCFCAYRWYGRAEGREDHHGNPVHPIYSSDEHDGMGCNSCGEELKW